ncbi:hypothetical protein A0H81_11122 [Grifola frondosa]|uniref:Uncharacterized protein n=1 Tax=Grifola frondosa TaxID=5627 RepID=A0A1C7LW45_GRIFR|nr:hypothetical protein A0H81_11122 [Grifola frondosa]
MPSTGDYRLILCTCSLCKQVNTEGLLQPAYRKRAHQFQETYSRSAIAIRGRRAVPVQRAINRRGNRGRIGYVQPPRVTVDSVGDRILRSRGRGGVPTQPFKRSCQTSPPSPHRYSVVDQDIVHANSPALTHELCDFPTPSGSGNHLSAAIDSVANEDNFDDTRGERRDMDQDLEKLKCFSDMLQYRRWNVHYPPLRELISSMCWCSEGNGFPWRSRRQHSARLVGSNAVTVKILHWHDKFYVDNKSR